MLYCMKCGSQNDESSSYCLFCGEQIDSFGGKHEGGGRHLWPDSSMPSEKDWLITLLLAIFLGQFGMARFYTGSIGFGILQLLTAGGCGIWWLIDIILIVTDKYHDKWGRLLVKR